MKHIAILICALSFLHVTSLSFAGDKVVVIPLFSSEKKIKNIVTVAKSGGDFTDPVAAVKSITDAGANNQYLIALGPGVYKLDSALILKPFISLVGSGKDVTVLTSNDTSFKNDNDAMIVQEFGNAISNLTIDYHYLSSNKLVGIRLKNNSTVKETKILVAGTNVVGVEIPTNSHDISISNSEIEVMGDIQSTGMEITGSIFVVIETVKIKPEGNNEIYGISCVDGGQIIMTNTDINTGVINPTFGETMYGIYLENGDIFASNSRVAVYGKTASTAIYFKYGGRHSVIRNIYLSFGVGHSNTGIYLESSSPILNNITEFSTYVGSEDTSHGIYITGTSAPTISASNIVGETSGLYTDSTEKVSILRTSLSNGVSGSGQKSCINSDNGVDQELDKNCNEIAAP